MNNLRNVNNALKTTFFGSSVVGKTCVISRIKNNTFNSEECTIGVSFTRIIQDGVNYSVWDTAGQDRFHTLLPMYFRGSSILVFVFDLSDEKSILSIDKYITQLYNLSDCFVIIVGNKADLVAKEDIQQIDIMIRKKIERSLISDKVSNYVYMSAKTGEGSNDLLNAMYECANKVISLKRNESVIKLDEHVKLTEPTDEYNKCSC